MSKGIMGNSAGFSFSGRVIGKNTQNLHYINLISATDHVTVSIKQGLGLRTED